MAFAKLNSMKFVGLDGLSHFWSKAKAYTDTVCCNTITRDTLCTSCAKAYSDTKSLCACTYAASCIGTMSTLCTSCAKAYSDTNALCACTYAGSCINTKAENGLACAYSCANTVCCNTITRDTLCTSCAYSCANTKGDNACTYANSVAGQCKDVACTYANCAINTCKGIGVMGVARETDAQCWTKGGYWAYMTSKDGPNCDWNHVIKMDWSDTGADPWATGISIPTYNAPDYGIYYKHGCCGGHSSWTLVPNVTCSHCIGTSCKTSACNSAIAMDKVCLSCSYKCTDTKALCACAFAATCAQSVVPETSTFAKCYGNSTNCVECADKVRIKTSSSNVYHKIPFASTNGTTSTSVSLNLDAYPSYNPANNVSCVYTECVASTLAVPNGNGHFRLGSYCIYIG